jgi:hypothetical protein
VFALKYPADMPAGYEKLRVPLVATAAEAVVETM